MDSRSIRPDPCDNRIIRCQNCLQLLSCVCDIAACLSDNQDLHEAARCLHTIADCAYYTVLGCMVAQVALELSNHPGQGNMGAPIPQALTSSCGVSPPIPALLACSCSPTACVGRSCAS